MDYGPHILTLYRPKSIKKKKKKNPPQTYGEEIYEEGQSDNPAQLIPTIPHYDELSVRVVQNCMNIKFSISK